MTILYLLKIQFLEFCTDYYNYSSKNKTGRKNCLIFGFSIYNIIHVEKGMYKYFKEFKKNEIGNIYKKP